MLLIWHQTRCMATQIACQVIFQRIFTHVFFSWGGSSTIHSCVVISSLRSEGLIAKEEKGMLMYYYYTSFVAYLWDLLYNTFSITHLAVAPCTQLHAHTHTWSNKKSAWPLAKYRVVRLTVHGVVFSRSVHPDGKTHEEGCPLKLAGWVGGCFV